MRKTSFALFMVAALVAAPFGAAWAEGVVFLVRHAERSNAVTDDSDPLLPQGHARARSLARLLGDAGIEELITTNALRSQQTGAPFATATGLKPQVMTRDEEVALAGRLREKPDSKDRLMVAHTRNIPRILEAFGVPGGAEFKLNPATDYDNLFIIQLYPNRPASMVRLRYQTIPD